MRGTPLLVSALASVACGAGDSSEAAAVDGAEWTIRAEPVLVLEGAADVAGAAFLTDGTVVVLDAVERRLHFYAADGRLRRSVGREGTGPGEFAWRARLPPGATVEAPTVGHVDPNPILSRRVS